MIQFKNYFIIIKVLTCVTKLFCNWMSYLYLFGRGGTVKSGEKKGLLILKMALVFVEQPLAFTWVCLKYLKTSWQKASTLNMSLWLAIPSAN